MREIKFRGWHEGLKEMVYQGEHCGYLEYSTNPVNAINIILNEDNDGYIYMQYTGLKDKNGTEVYEGDIIKGQELRKDVMSEYISEVFFEDGCWLVHESKTCDVELYLYDNTNPTKMPLTEIEVIGNIWENPELLK